MCVPPTWIMEASSLLNALKRQQIGRELDSFIGAMIQNNQEANGGSKDETKENAEEYLNV